MDTVGITDTNIFLARNEKFIIKDNQQLRNKYYNNNIT